MKIDITLDEAEVIRAASEHFNAYLRGQQRKDRKREDGWLSPP